MTLTQICMQYKRDKEIRNELLTPGGRYSQRSTSPRSHTKNFHVIGLVGKIIVIGVLGYTKSKSDLHFVLQATIQH